MAHTFNPKTREAETGGFLILRPAWSIEWVPGQPGIYRETLSLKTSKQANKQTNKIRIIHFLFSHIYKPILKSLSHYSIILHFSGLTVIWLFGFYLRHTVMAVIDFVCVCVWPFNIIFRVVVSPKHKIISLLLHSCILVLLWVVVQDI